MLKLIGLCIKLSIFAVIAIIAGSWIHWNGRSLTSHVLGAADKVKDTVTIPMASTVSKKVNHLRVETKKKISVESKAIQEEAVSAVERMKMRSLIQEVETH